MLPVTQALIFDKGGRVVWRHNPSDESLAPINGLIGTVLLEEKGAGQRARILTDVVEWRHLAKQDWVLVVTWPSHMELECGDVLEKLRTAVARMDGFDPRVMQKTFEAACQREAHKASAPTPEEVVEELSVAEKLKRRGVKSRKDTTKKKVEDVPTKKKATVWRDGSQKKATAAEIKELDYTAKLGGGDRPDNEMQRYMPEANETAAWDEDDAITVLLEDDDDEKKGWLSGFITNSAVLTSEQVEPIMAQLKDRLVAKNVAQEIASDITSSVAASLIGKKVERFGRATRLVREGLMNAVERILTPKRSTDVLREVIASKNRPKPYVIVFVGINGVGKSTTLSKVAYYLKSHGISLSIAACDTFRSGAVEQLRSHAKCLEVNLFERGYLKDPADVAKAAIDDAIKKNCQCVLVDTAGRMQNNDKLMRELAKLVSVNQPDLVLFVGEALVGNDGIDQLNMFNKSLATFSADGRAIDGIVLTKFDCIDDKVGATLSMTYKTGQPIVFVGVGQKYTHLKKLSVPAVINALFS